MHLDINHTTEMYHIWRLFMWEQNLYKKIINLLANNEYINALSFVHYHRQMTMMNDSSKQLFVYNLTSWNGTVFFMALLYLPVYKQHSDSLKFS